MQISIMNKTLHVQALAAWLVASVFSFVLMVGTFRASAPLRVFAMQTAIRIVTTAPPADTNGHTNVLLLGVGDKRHSGANLTDTMIVASIDPATKSAVLISIPRDLALVDEKGFTSGRINGLYATAKMSAGRQKGMTETGASLLAMESVRADMEELLGISLQGLAKMDFTGFETVIDEVGGVQIDVTDRLIDYTYPLKEGVTGTIEFQTGSQLMSGERALQYARSRHSTSDFDRSRRQQQILSALTKKVKDQNIIDNVELISSLRESLKNHFETTFTDKELIGLAAIVATIPQDHIKTMSLNTSIGGDYSDAQKGGFIRNAPPEIAGSGALLLPYSGTNDPSDWTQLKTLAYMLLENRELYLTAEPVTIKTDGAKTVTAHQLRNELTRYGFIVTEEKNDPKKIDTSANPVSSIVYGNDANQVRVEFFSKLLRMSAERNDNQKGIIIILGKDYRYQPMQKLLGM